MDFSVFDTAQMDAYAKQAKEQWGETDAYKEFEQKSQGRSRDEEQLIAERFMQKFADFGKIKDMKPEAAEAQNLVRDLQDYITQNFYQCSNDILCSLGQMYAGGGEFTDNIDRAGGKGTAAFVAEAIRIYAGKEQAR